VTPFDPAAAAPALLHWYDRHRRDLPWRAKPGHSADPYHIWLSEIMLQQTTVAAVKPYYDRFLRLFPTVEALANADREVVLGAWAGLGYYARARNLHACAQQVAALGGFPRTLDGLRALPGIGAYTSAAIGAIAFGLAAIPVDGNVERITSRVFALTDPLPRGRPALHRAAETLGTAPEARARPSDFAQALFDLGASLCSPRNPACTLCPWHDPCEGRAQGIAGTLPRRAPKAVRPVRYGTHFHLIDASGALLLRRRPDTGLLGGMTELPGSTWRDAPPDFHDALDEAGLTPLGLDEGLWVHAGTVAHVFTHFTLMLEIFCARSPVPCVGSNSLYACSEEAVETAALPSVMRKGIALARAQLAPAPTAPVGRTTRKTPRR